MTAASRLACATATLLALASTGCRPSSGAEGAGAGGDEGSPAGAPDVPVIHLFENHSSALIAWRRAKVNDRVLVHLDGHADIDWLPEETVARIAAAHPDELSDLELHPYAIDDTTLSRFGIWNFIYPAARMGLVREVVWVVPDGTLRNHADAARLVREIVLEKMQMIPLQEARSLHLSGITIQGVLFGVPITICQLADLPSFAEPVLLDVDLDYFTTRSAVTQEVLTRPWISPENLVHQLAQKGLRTDRVTLSLSTLGGYLPPSSRWLARDLKDRLRRIEPFDAEERRQAQARVEEGDIQGAVARYRDMAARQPSDAQSWYALSRLLDAGAETEGAAAARGRAITLDPILAHDDLFEGDRLWLNHDFAGALEQYRRYLDRGSRADQSHPFDVYARRRLAGCLMFLGRHDEAVDAFREVVRLAPDHADTRLDLGVLLRDRGQVADAIGQFRAARRLQPDLATAAMALGTTYLMAGEVEQGVAELEVAVLRKPCWAMAHGNLAAGLAELGRREEAARHVETALSLQPANPQVQRIAGELKRRGVQVSRVSAPSTP